MGLTCKPKGKQEHMVQKHEDPANPSQLISHKP